MSRPLKILHYIPTYAPAWKFGGPTLSVSQLCEGLVDLGHEIEVFTSNAGLEDHPEIPLNEPIDRNGVKVTYFEQKPGMGIQCPGMEKAVSNRVKEFDLVHITAIWQSTSRAACKAAQREKIPYIISPRGSLCPYSWQQKTLKKALFYLLQERFNLHNAAAIHYTAEQELNECTWLKIPGESFVVPNGFNTNFWQPDQQGAIEWRKLQKIDSAEFIFLNVGRLHHKKGLDLLVKAFAAISDLKWQLIFVGGNDDGTKELLESKFKDDGLLDRVRFIDRCEPKDLPKIYSAANLFVLPSRHENFGNVVIEALSCECPVLISDRVGLHQEISKSNLGWVLPRIERLWAETMRELIISPSKLTSIKSNSVELVKSLFSFDITAKKMLDAYMKIIDLQIK